MNLQWKYDVKDIDWLALAELYRIAPLGEKDPAGLELVFGSSIRQPEKALKQSSKASKNFLQKILKAFKY